MLEVRPFSFRDRRFRELLTRRQVQDPELEDRAREDIARIVEGGEQALAELVRLRDCPEADTVDIRVSAAELLAARESVPETFLTALSLSRVNLRKFHEYQRRKGYLHDDGDGVRLSRQVRSLSRVGIYCGSSFASLLALAVPAQVAGVAEIVVAAAPRANGEIDPHLLATAKVLGIDEIYRMSGPHAIAALANGVDSIRAVDKIVGAGNGLVHATKPLLCDRVGIEAGLELSELLVIADETANARFIAVDLVAQAECNRDCGLLVLLTCDRLLAEAVRIEVDRLVERNPDAAGLAAAFSRWGAILVCMNLDTAIQAANALAPARLSLMTRDDELFLSDIDNVGAVSLGPWTVEAAAGVFAGANPFLPVAGAARFSSGLGVEDFTKEITVVEYSPNRLLKTGRHLGALAEADGSPAQVEAVRERLELLKLTVE